MSLFKRALLGVLICCLLCLSAGAAEEGRPITIVYNRGIAPIKFTDAAGKPAGLLNDYWRLLAEKAGLNLNFVEADSFDESLNMVKSGRVDLHSGLFRTAERSKFLSYSKPVLDLKYYIYSSDDLPPFKTLEETRGYLVGVVQGGYTENYIKKVVPKSHLIIYDDFNALFQAVLAGDIKVFVASDIHLNYYLAAKGLENPFKHQASSLYEQTYYGATAKANQALMDKIIAGQKLITAADDKALKDRWLKSTVNAVVRPQIKTLTEEEIAWIKAHPVIRVANEMDYPPFDFNQDGQPKGLSIDLLNLIAARTGLHLEYLYGYSWKQLLEMVRQKQLDIIHSLNSSAERAEYILFTAPYVSNQTVVVTAAGNDEIHDVADLEHKTIAVVEGYNTLRVLKEQLHDARFLVVGSPLEALKAVSSGQADATVRYDGVASYLINNHFLNNLKFVNEFKVKGDSLQELFFGVRNDWPMLQSILQKGLDSVTTEELNGLKRKWIGFDKGEAVPRIQLSEAERQWVADHPQITLGSDYKWPPFDFADQQGRHTGLSADYVRLIAERTGLQINVRTGVWADILKQMQAGELDGLACAVETEERKSYLDFSKPYLSVPTVIIVKDDNSTVNDISDLYGKTVSINKSSYMHDWLVDRYPQIKLHLSTSNEASIEAVSYGEADAYIGNLAVANYIIRERLLTNLKVVKRLDGMMTRTAVAIDKQKPLLMSIIQKALDSITAQERQAILGKWYLESIEEKLVLTDREQAWMAQHPVIRVAGNLDWAPVSYRDQNGNYAGIAAEYLQRLADKSKLKFEAVKVEDWQKALTLVQTGEVDILNAVSKVAERGTLVDFTDSYMQAEAVLITRSDIQFLKGLGQLGDRRLGTVGSFVIADYLQRDYPDLQLRRYKNAASGLQALSHGEVDVFILDIPSFEYYSRKLSLANLKISGVTPYRFQIAIGVAKGNPELVSILNKAFALLSPQEKNEIYNSWVALKEPLIDYSLLWKTLLGASVFLLALFFWNRRLAQEVTLRKEAEHQALQASRSKSDFLANMSHEIRTPMNSVLGFAELLDNMIDDPEQKSYLKSIRTGGKALLEIINDILDLSKIEAGKMVIKPEPLSLGNLFGEMEDFFRARMAQKNLHFSCRIAGDFPAYIMIDGVRLRQVLINLIGNALKFTEAGSISLDCNNIQQDGETQTVSFTLVVTDTGIGIPRQYQEEIFNKFEQLNRDGSARYGGTGLGLSISKNLSELMGGDLRVESVPGEGAAFFIDFAAIPVAEVSRDKESREVLSVSQFLPAEVLVADDVADNRRLVIGFFKGSAVHFHEAENGQKALELLSQKSVDMVLMDLRMPVLNGYETITAMRQDARLQQIPVVAFTASVMGEDLEKVHQYGFDSYLRKPVNQQELLQVAARFLPLAEEQEEAVAVALEAVDVSLPQRQAFLATVEAELLPAWLAVKDKGDFELISQFAVALREQAGTYSIQPLVDFADRLLEKVTSFDIIEVDGLMNQFPELISAMQRRVASEGEV